MARKHAFGLIRRFDRGQKPPERRRGPDRTMFRALRIETVEARVLLSAVGVDADGLLDLAFDQGELRGQAFVLSVDSVMVRSGHAFVLGVDSVTVLGVNRVLTNQGVGPRATFGFSASTSPVFSAGNEVIDATDQPKIKMQTPALAPFVPKEPRDTSLAKAPEELVDITVVMSKPQRPTALKSVWPRKELRREVEQVFARDADENDQPALAVNVQYALAQTFELSGGDFDSVEAGEASVDRQSSPSRPGDPPSRHDDPSPHRGGRPSGGDVTRATFAIDRQELAARGHVLLGSPAEAARRAGDESRDDGPVTLSPPPIGGSSHAALFDQLGDEFGDGQASDLFRPAAYLDHGRSSSIAPAMLFAVGGQLLFGASWRAHRRISPEPAVERPLRQ